MSTRTAFNYRVVVFVLLSALFILHHIHAEPWPGGNELVTTSQRNVQELENSAGAILKSKLRSKRNQELTTNSTSVATTSSSTITTRASTKRVTVKSTLPAQTSTPYPDGSKRETPGASSKKPKSSSEIKSTPSKLSNITSAKGHSSIKTTTGTPLAKNGSTLAGNATVSKKPRRPRPIGKDADVDIGDWDDEDDMEDKGLIPNPMGTIQLGSQGAEMFSKSKKSGGIGIREVPDGVKPTGDQRAETFNKLGVKNKLNTSGGKGRPGQYVDSSQRYDPRNEPTDNGSTSNKLNFSFALLLAAIWLDPIQWLTGLIMDCYQHMTLRKAHVTG